MISFKTSFVIISTITFVFINTSCHAEENDCIDTINNDIFTACPDCKSSENSLYIANFIFHSITQDKVKYEVTIKFLDYIFIAIKEDEIDDGNGSRVRTTQSGDEFCKSTVTDLSQIDTEKKIDVEAQKTKCLAILEKAEFDKTDFKKNLKKAFYDYTLESTITGIDDESKDYFDGYISHLHLHYNMDNTKLVSGNILEKFCEKNDTDVTKLVKK